MAYLNDLINNGFVNVGKCDFLSEEFHVHRGEGLAVRLSLPLRKLCEKENSNIVKKIYKTIMLKCF